MIPAYVLLPEVARRLASQAVTPRRSEAHLETIGGIATAPRSAAPVDDAHLLMPAAARPRIEEFGSAMDDSLSLRRWATARAVKR
jgi:hypothetical protein